MVMKVVIFFLSLFFASFASAQGVLESRLIGGKPGESCTMLVRNLNNFERVDEYHFREMSKVVMRGGDYRVTYWVDSTLIHQEYVHFSANDHGVVQKFIFRIPQPIMDVDFKQFKLMTPEDFQSIYMEF